MADESESSTAVVETPAPAADVAPESSAPSRGKIAADDAGFDRKGLESSVAAGLAAVFSDEDTEPVVEEKPAKTPVTAKVDEVETEVESEVAPKESTEPQEPAAEKPVAETAETETAPTLPAAYVRSLKAYDWTDEEIAEASKYPQFVTTAALIHKNRNKEVSQWADAGRKAREVQAQPQTSQENAAPINDPLAQLKPVDTVALKKLLGDDALVDHLAGPLNATIKQINAVLPIVMQVQGRAKQAEIEMLGNQIEGFFKSDDVKPFADTFGVDASKLSKSQIEMRNGLLQQADALMVGAKMQGRTLTFNEAMTHALDSVTGDVKVQAARTTIKKQLKTRERGISLRPLGRGAGAVSGPVKSRQDLERKVRDGLATVFG